MPMWNPWHGCHKISEGCRHCYVYRQDAAFGTPNISSRVERTSSFYLPVRQDRHNNWKYPAGTEFGLCFTSDMLVNEADGWRDEIWEMIRTRSDCSFVFFTKRIDRLAQCLPADWGDGYENVVVGCTVENQDRADYRLPIFLDLPLRHRLIVAAPLLGEMDISRYLDPVLVTAVTVGGESGKYARPLHFDWVTDLHRQCVSAGVPFTFHQTGAYLVKDGRQYEIPRSLQHSQAKKAGLDTFKARR